METDKPSVKSNLIHTKEIVNWVAFRRFCEHLKEFLKNAERSDEAIVVEVWKFPQSKPPQKQDSQKMAEQVKD